MSVSEAFSAVDYEMNEKGTVIFDLDGTLVDSAPDLANSLNVVLEEYGRSRISESEVRNMIGHGVGELVRAARSGDNNSPQEPLIETAIVRFRCLYSRNLSKHSTVYPNTASTLAILKQEGWRLVVCTNKIEGSARKVLREFQLLDFFDDVVGPDTYGVSKPNPEHLQKCVSDKWASLPTIMVGDSEVDCAAAKAAGFPMALVDWGYNKGRLSELEPNFVLSDIREIHQILDKISSN